MKWLIVGLALAVPACAGLGFGGQERQAADIVCDGVAPDIRAVLEARGRCVSKSSSPVLPPR